MMEGYNNNAPAHGGGHSEEHDEHEHDKEEAKKKKKKAEIAARRIKTGDYVKETHTDGFEYGMVVNDWLRKNLKLKRLVSKRVEDHLKQQPGYWNLSESEKEVKRNEHIDDMISREKNKDGGLKYPGYDHFSEEKKNSLREKKHRELRAEDLYSKRSSFAKKWMGGALEKLRDILFLDSKHLD